MTLVLFLKKEDELRRYVGFQAQTPFEQAVKSDGQESEINGQSTRKVLLLSLWKFKIILAKKIISFSYK